MALLTVFGSVNSYATEGSWADDRLSEQSENSNFIDVYDTKTEFVLTNQFWLASLAYLVNNGVKDFAGKTIKLGGSDEWSLSSHYWVPIGTAEHPFKGTFDFEGRTLVGVYNDPSNAGFGGLFGYIGEGGRVEGLKIRDSQLRGAGYVGGIAAYNYGGTITDCVVKSTVKVSATATGTNIGGIAGANHGPSENERGTVSGCVSSATFSSTNSPTIGGLVGTKGNNYIMYCLYLGAEESLSGGFVMGKGDIGGNGDNTLNMSTVSNGSQNNVSRAFPITNGNTAVTVNYQGTPTATYSRSDIKVYNDVDGMYGIWYNGVYYSGEYGSVKFKVTPNTTGYTVSNVTADSKYNGSLTLTVTEDVYSFDNGRNSVTINCTTKLDNWEGGGTGTASDPYKISTVEQWNAFVNLVKNSYSFSGQYVKLTSDIELQFTEAYAQDGSLTATPHLVGTDENRFAGTFDGDGHTITLDQNIRRNNTPSALFRYVRNATIKNLIVDGTFTNSMYAVYNAGLVAVADGSTTISNCIVKPAITCDTPSGNRGNAGIVGHLQNTSGMTNSLTMTGCAFLGSLLKYDDDVPMGIGGLLGYAAAGTSATFTDCLFDPAKVTMGTTGSSTLARYDGDATLTFSGCYYTKSLGEAQGTSAAIISDATGAGSAGTSHGYITPYTNGLCLSVNSGSTYYTPTQSPGTETTISLSDGSANSSTLWVNKGRTVNVTLNGRTFFSNEWNTLCLPFAMNATQIAASPLAGATFMELDFDDTYGGAENYTHFDSENGTLYLYFKDATEIKAGKPYIVKPTSETTSPTFTGVTITTSTASTESAEVGVSFVGTFDPAPLTVGSSLNLYIGAENKLCYPSGVESFSVGAFRAYFVVDPSESGALDPEYPVRAIYMNLDDEASSIREIESEYVIRNSVAIYDLNGRKLSESGIRNSGLKKGLYIKNGRKYLIK